MCVRHAKQSKLAGGYGEGVVYIALCGVVWRGSNMGEKGVQTHFYVHCS